MASASMTNNVSDDPSDTTSLREEGNKLFTSGDYSGALELYTKALKLLPMDSNERLVFYKNRAAAYIKLKEYKEALCDCNIAAELAPTDIKVLFRRCQAYENLENYNEAFKDALRIQHLTPRNNVIKPVLQRLSVKLQQIAKEQSTTMNKVKSMFTLLLDNKASSENRSQAANNLIVLARENAGSELIIKEDGIPKLMRVMKMNDEDISLSCVRVLSELCHKEDKAIIILEQVGLPFIMENMNSESEQHISVTQYWIQVIINSLSGMDAKQGKKPIKELMKANENRLDTIMMTLVKMTCSRTMSAIGRDAILELITKNVDMEALNWGMKLVDGGGLSSLLEVASELEEMKYESCMNITANTRIHIAVTLERVYWCMDYDKARQKYMDKVTEYVKGFLRDPGIESKVRATAIITTLLQGPIDVGNHCIGQKGIVEMMLVMAGTDDVLQQKVAAEAIIAAATKKDKCTSIVSMGTNILKKLYQSKNDNIKIRGLVTSTTNAALQHSTAAASSAVEEASSAVQEEMPESGTPESQIIPQPILPPNRARQWASGGNQILWQKEI